MPLQAAEQRSAIPQRSPRDRAMRMTAQLTKPVPAARDRRPGLDPRRLTRLMRAAIERCQVLHMQYTATTERAGLFSRRIRSWSTPLISPENWDAAASISAPAPSMRAAAWARIFTVQGLLGAGGVVYDHYELDL
jgi:hypothetical protein